jgi:hypothetical protein
MMVMTGNREKKTTYFALFLHWANIEQEREMKKIITVNAGPEMGWNKESLIMEASKGAESAGATVERFDLFRLEKYTGCISCFKCKTKEFKGHCVCRDGLTPVLDAIQEAISEIKKTCRWCIVVAHAGEEFTPLPSPYTRDRYHLYLQMGADFVVSHHPHVPMNYEMVGDKAIFYSLGNFIFDTPYQRSQFNTEKGLLLQLDLSSEKWSFKPYGIDILRDTERIDIGSLPVIFQDKTRHLQPNTNCRLLRSLYNS